MLTATAFADPLIGERWGAVTLADKMGHATEWRPGKVTVLSFFACWCDTWRTQTARLENTQDALRGLPVDVNTVSIDGRWMEVLGKDDRLPLLVDANGGWSRKKGVDRVPTTVVLDASGVVRWVHSGVVRQEDLVRQARAALRPPIAGAVYLVFENFPPKEGGHDLLDLLRKERVQATFVVEDPMSAFAREARGQGHEIETAFRAKRGAVVDPFDAARPGALEISRRVLESIRPGIAIKLHADVSQTLAALPQIIHSLRNLGFSFGLFKIHSSNSSRT